MLKMQLNPSMRLYTGWQLMGISFVYVEAAANEYWLVNWLKIQGVNLPIFFALCQNAGWPIMYLGYQLALRSTTEPRKLTMNQYKNYMILGLLNSFISLSRMFGLSILDPVLYVICANTEIVFETLMTKFILGKTVSWLQITAVFFVLFAGN